MTLTPKLRISLRYLILFISFALLSVHVAAQPQVIDSLQRELTSAKSVKEKVEIYNALSFQYFDYNLSEADKSSAQAIKLAQTTTNKVLIGSATCYRGYYYYLSGNLTESQKYFIAAKRLGEEIKDYHLLTYSLTQLGNTLRDKGNYDSSLYYYQQAEKAILNKPDYLFQSILKINISRYYLAIDKADDALRYAIQAEELRKKMNMPNLQAFGYVQTGLCQAALSNLTEAEKSFTKAKYLVPEDPAVEAEVQMGMAQILYMRGKFKEAIEAYTKALSFHRKSGYQFILSTINLKMGEVFQEEGFYDLAVNYLNQTMQVAEEKGYARLKADALYYLGWTFYRSRDYKNSNIYIKKAYDQYQYLKLSAKADWCLNLFGLLKSEEKKYDSAFYFLNSSLSTSKAYKILPNISANLFNLGEIFLAQQDYSRALIYYWQGLKIDIAIGDEYGQCLYYNRIGKIYTRTNTFDSAKYYLDKALALAVPTSGTDIFRVTYIDMADYLQKTGKPEQALAYYKKYNLFSDSLFNRQKAQSQAAFEALYNIEKRENEITILEKTNELNQSKLLVQRGWVVLFSIITLFSLAAGIFYYRFAGKLKKLNREILEQNEEIQAQAEELSEANTGLVNLNREIAYQKKTIEDQAEELSNKNKEISSINEELESKIESRTSELKQAYKELDTFFYRSSHDFRRPLTTFMGLAEVARLIVKDETAIELFNKVDENARNLDKMIRKLQSISDLGTQELIFKEILLKEVVQQELEEIKTALNDKNLQVTLSINENQTLHSYAALVHIIVRNVLENAVAFCKEQGGKIAIVAYQKDNGVQVEIKDEGMGIPLAYQNRVFDMYFRANENSKGNGLGLYIVKKAIQKLHGNIELYSEENVGTKVTFWLPSHQ
ncbi:MAG: tetratricopeptide repeat protein [Cyclobacteriaceae bacterium]|nr:tetratricopeptide repeat protein [Cyclobacteriaceae bacterium]